MPRDIETEPRSQEAATKPVVQRPKGTRDFLPADMERRRWLETQLRTTAGLFGFREVGTPAFEHVELFTLRSGQGIIGDMYDFKDKGGRHLALRPELTAPTMRLYIEGLTGDPKPLKLFYFGNCFRYEQPQRGRYREFWQFGAEILGAKRVPGEVELLSLADACLKASGLKRYILRIGHVGVLRKLLENAGIPPEKQAPLMPLIDKKDHEALRTSLESMGADAGHVMEVLGSSGGREILSKVPGSGLEEVLDGLARTGIDGYVIEPGIARGLDYYTGMVFEGFAPNLGAEDQVLGGGAYRLAHLFGGDDVPSCGFAIGFDRLMVSLGEVKAARQVRVAICTTEEGRIRGFEVAKAFRERGICAELDLLDRNLGAQMAHAAKAADFAVILGQREVATGTVTLKNLQEGEQKVVPLEIAVAEVAARVPR
jgi:histidyl-tRNA synthetase